MKRLLLIVALAVSSVAQAQYPDRPVRMVVPYSPGGLVDIVARYVTAKLPYRTIVENKVGAGGLIAGREVERAKPDGYTLLVGNVSPNGVNPAWFHQPPEDGNLRLAPVAMIGGQPFMLLTKDETANAHAVIAAVRGGKPYGTDGVGGIGNLSMESIAPGGVQVPYKGTAPLVVDIAGGLIYAGFAPAVVAAPWVSKGTLRAVAQTSATRSPQFPDVPTLRELGYQYDSEAWVGLFAPEGTPPAIITAWNLAIAEVLRDGTWFRSNGIVARVMTPDEFGKFVRDEQTKYRAIASRMMVK